MSVAPDHSDRIVTLSLHVGRIDIFWHFLDFKDLSAVDLIHAKGTLTHETKVVRVNGLLEHDLPLRSRFLACILVLLNQNFAFDGVVSGLHPLQ